MSTENKLSKAWTSKIIQLGKFFSYVVSDLGDLGKTSAKDALKNLAIHLAKDVVLGFVRNISSNIDFTGGSEFSSYEFELQNQAT